MQVKDELSRNGSGTFGKVNEKKKEKGKRAGRKWKRPDTTVSLPINPTIIRIEPEDIFPTGLEGN